MSLVTGPETHTAPSHMLAGPWRMAATSVVLSLVRLGLPRGRKFQFPGLSSWAHYWQLDWQERLLILSALFFLRLNSSRIPLRCLECFIAIQTPSRNSWASGLPKSKRIQMSKTGHGFPPMLTQLIWVPGQMWFRLT